MKIKKRLVPGALVHWCTGNRKGFTPLEIGCRRQPSDARGVLSLTGFTVLELLVVMVIMGMVIAMSVPAISGHLRGARLRGGAQEVASALRMARQLAITKRAIYTVDCNITNREFRVRYGGTIIETKTLPETIRFHSATTWTYNFSARGTATAGSIYIVDPNNNGMRIVITGATGRVRIEHWSP